ncbi:MAG: helix-turn-helix transcriptional regulator [Lachnospiraceae bacterium]|nr:helix-turn-helix transcriptional regulator [Lachnospiraceae bacterium]
MQDIKQNLANAVREYRTELGLSQEKLAEILNLDQRTILNIEAGRGNPIVAVRNYWVYYFQFFVLIISFQKSYLCNILIIT